MEFNYETIKALAKQTRRKITDLIALAPQNDPFYTGTPSEIKLGEWFADFYHRSYDPGTRMHVRRCHYRGLCNIGTEKWFRGKRHYMQLKQILATSSCLGGSAI